MLKKGFALPELIIILAIIAILVLISIPTFLYMRQKSHDASAEAVGKSLQLAEESYYNSGQDQYGTYTSDLNKLLEMDRNLTDDPNVTFTFTHASSSGYTAYTTHRNGTGRTFLWHD